MSAPDIDLNLFKFFQAIYRTGNISKAAHYLNVTQPTVSKNLAKLRKLFNDPLFVYISKVMQPTEKAIQIAESISDGVDKLQTTLKENQPFDPRAGEHTFRISMSDYLEELILAKLLRKLDEMGAKIKIEIVHLEMMERHKGLEKSTTDLNIHGSIKDVHYQKYGSGILQKFLFEDRYVFVVGAHHKIAHEVVTMEKLAQLHHVRYGISRIIDKLMLEQNLCRKVVLQVPHILVLPKIVTDSDLVATLPERLALHYKSILPIKIIKSPENMPHLKFHMYWHEKNQNSQANLWLRSMFTCVASEL